MGEGGSRSGPGFLVVLKPILGPKISPKICLKFVNFWVQFWTLFCWGFGALWVPLGSLLGPFEALLGGLKSEKMPTVLRENQSLSIQFFGFLKLLMALFGLSWSLLGGSGPKRGFQNDLKSLVKSDQKVVQKMIKKRTNFGFQNGCQKVGKPRSPA